VARRRLLFQTHDWPGYFLAPNTDCEDVAGSPYRTVTLSRLERKASITPPVRRGPARAEALLSEPTPLAAAAA